MRIIQSRASGLGALVAAYPRYETLYDGKLVDHVHNDYIEMLAETGLLGGICGLAFLWILFRQAKACYAAEQGHFSRALHAGAVTGLCGMLLHSFVDFNLHIPSNALLFLLLAHLATSPPLATEAVVTRRRARITRKNYARKRISTGTDVLARHLSISCIAQMPRRSLELLIVVV